MKRVNITMRPEFYKELKKKAKEHGMNVSEYVRFALLKLWEGN